MNTEPTEDSLLDAKYEELMASDESAEAPEAEEPAAVEAGVEEPAVDQNASDKEAEEEGEEKPAEEGEQKAESVPAMPTVLPLTFKGAWDQLDDDGRRVAEETYKGIQVRMSDLGRQVKEFEPSRAIHEQIEQARQKLPALADMKPEAIARDAIELAGVQARLAADPTGTLKEIAVRYGVNLQELAQSTPPEQQEAQALQQQVQMLTQQVQELQNPERIQQVVSQTTSQAEVNSALTDIESREHYGAVSDILPHYLDIAIAKSDENASHRAVLEKAYEMAITAEGLKQQPAPSPNPVKLEKARNAKALKLASKPAGGEAPLSEDDALNAVWDKLHAS